MAISLTTVTSLFKSNDTQAIYCGPPPHVSSARLLTASATINGACAAAASDNITIVHPTDSSAAIATGPVSAAGTEQIVTLTVTDATAAAHPFSSTEMALITLPNCGAVTCPVQIQITWDDSGITSA